MFDPTEDNSNDEERRSAVSWTGMLIGEGFEGSGTSAALRGLPIGVTTLPWATPARSSSLGYWPSSR